MKPTNPHEFLANFLLFLNQTLPRLRGKAPNERQIEPNTTLFEDGTLDSLSILDVLAFIEAQIEIAVPDEMILPANFRSPSTVAQAFWRLRQ